jgi:hypothetical protein
MGPPIRDVINDYLQQSQSAEKEKLEGMKAGRGNMQGAKNHMGMVLKLPSGDQIVQVEILECGFRI